MLGLAAFVRFRVRTLSLRTLLTRVPRAANSLPKVNALIGRQIVFVARLDGEGVVPFVLIAGGTDDAEFGRAVLIRQGLGAQG